MANIHILNTGRELMLGRRLNTHAQWLCDQFCRAGYDVACQEAVDDSAPAILGALRRALDDQADLIVTTGGLGPTSDDRTRDLIAELLGRPLQNDPAVLDHIRAFFAARQRACPDRVLVQAQVPEGANVLMNEHGTAPGLVMSLPPDPPRTKPAWLVMLPGPPRELRPMFLKQVLPILREHLPPPSLSAYRVLRTTGLGESMVEDKLGPILHPLEKDGLEVGYCARPGEVDIHLLVRGAKGGEVVRQAESLVLEHAGPLVFGADHDLLEEVVIRLLASRTLHLAIAESCTGGLLSHRLTNVPGASEVLLAGWITYSNAAKQSQLGVAPDTLARHGAVSAETAREMALGARERAGADYALAVTGIAGPGGGSQEKPVGTVYLGLAGPDFVETRRQLNPFDRETFKYVTTQQALDWLRQVVQAAPGAP